MRQQREKEVVSFGCWETRLVPLVGWLVLLTSSTHSASKAWPQTGSSLMMSPSSNFSMQTVHSLALYLVQVLGFFEPVLHRKEYCLSLAISPGFRPSFDLS